MALFCDAAYQLFCIAPILLDDRDGTETYGRGYAVACNAASLKDFSGEFHKSVVIHSAGCLYVKLHGGISGGNIDLCYFCHSLRI